MGSNGGTSVAVVGAAGFVGRELLRQLEALGIRATAVVRGLPELSVEGTFHVACSEPASLEPDGFDVVVNLAYPTSQRGYEYPDDDAAIGRTVSGLVKDGGRLVQVSTLAVFGMALDQAISAGPVARRRDNVYVESKISAEHLYCEMQLERGLSVDIVRLGNVWGYASGTWAVPLVQRLLTGRPVGIAGSLGRSNTTDVANVASYLAFLIRDEDPGLGVRYHHLAEFSDVRWDEWIVPLAERMGVAPVYADASVLDVPSSVVRELAETFTSIRPRSVYRSLGDERVTGSWTRTFVRQLPRKARSRLQSSGVVFASDPTPERSEQTFLAIMAGRQRFASVLRAGWAPTLTKEQSLERVIRWLDRG